MGFTIIDEKGKSYDKEDFDIRAWYNDTINRNAS